MMTEPEKIQTLRIALDLALEWLVCVEPHIQDSPPFKRDKQKLQDAMKRTGPLRDLPSNAGILDEVRGCY